MPRKTFGILSILMALSFVPAVAQRLPERYEAVLIPFVGAVRAPTGIWYAQIWFRNDGDEPADVFPLVFGGGLPPPPGSGSFYATEPAIPARATLLNLAGDAIPSFPIPPAIPVDTSTPGAFLYVERSKLDRVTIGALLTWASFDARAQIMPIPIARASEFLQRRASILPVAIEAQHRYALRIFAHPDSLSASTIHVRVFDMQPRFVDRPEEKLLLTTTVRLSADVDQTLPPCSNPCDIPPLRFKPAYAEVFDLSGIATAPEGAVLRIELEPEDPALRYWAVVSATDNRTNAVKFFVPR